ncbi:hypothetical protein ACFL26_02525 [Patescibacteria group bacterium]
MQPGHPAARGPQFRHPAALAVEFRPFGGGQPDQFGELQDEQRPPG